MNINFFSALQSVQGIHSQATPKVAVVSTTASNRSADVLTLANKHTESLTYSKPAGTANNTTNNTIYTLASIGQDERLPQVQESKTTNDAAASNPALRFMTISSYYGGMLTSVTTQTYEQGVERALPGRSIEFPPGGREIYFSKPINQFTYKATITDAEGNVISEHESNDYIISWNEKHQSWNTKRVFDDAGNPASVIRMDNLDTIYLYPGDSNRLSKEQLHKQLEHPRPSPEQMMEQLTPFCKESFLAEWGLTPWVSE
jgi:hypothetical protein